MKYPSPISHRSIGSIRSYQTSIESANSTEQDKPSLSPAWSTAGGIQDQFLLEAAPITNDQA